MHNTVELEPIVCKAVNDTHHELKEKRDYLIIFTIKIYSPFDTN